MLNFKGKITSGLNEASNFMKKEIYKKQYIEKLGFKPYYGTLNIVLENDVHLDIHGSLKKYLKTIKGNSEYGDVHFLKSRITNIQNNKSKTGFILFPTITIYNFNTLEFISKEHLRNSLNLNDEDIVLIELLIDEE